MSYQDKVTQGVYFSDKSSYHCLMWIGQIFKDRQCVVCSNLYTPNSSIQKVCFVCRRTYRKTYKTNWANNNKERVVVSRNKWYWENLDKSRTAKRKWNWSKKGQDYRKKYYIENKELINKRMEKYKDKTRSRIKANKIVNKLGWKRVCSFCTSIVKVNIHHKDCDPFNNSIENLQMLCLRCHTDFHHRKNMELDQTREV